MTYKELAEEIKGMSSEQQNQDVTVLVRGLDEFYPVTDRVLYSEWDEDVLDPDHPYLRV